MSSSSQKPLLWPVCRLRLACSRSFLSPPPGFVRLHRTATILSPAGTLLLITGWDPTAHHRLAPYSYLSAGTLLLIIIGWHPLCPVGPVGIYPSDRVASPRLRLVVVLHCLRDYCPTPWIDVITCLTVQHGFGRPSAGVFLRRRSTNLSRGQRFWPLESFLLFW